MKKAVRADLLDKLRKGNLDRNEAIELKNILEHDKDVAVRGGDAALLLGISLVLGLVINSLTQKKNPFGFLDDLFGWNKKKRKIPA
jgi:hypothetical protein